LGFFEAGTFCRWKICLGTLCLGTFCLGTFCRCTILNCPTISHSPGPDLPTTLYSQHVPLFPQLHIQGGAINAVFQCKGLHVLFKLMVALESTDWCWLSASYLFNEGAIFCHSSLLVAADEWQMNSATSWSHCAAMDRLPAGMA
jgi:hypothetical protein